MVDLTQTLLTILGVLIPWLASLLGFAYWLGGKFSSVDEMFNSINERLKLVDERFKSIDERFRDIDRRFEELKSYVDARFDDLKSYVDARFNGLKDYVDTRFNEMERRLSDLKDYTDSRFKDLRDYIDNRLLRLIESSRAYQEFFIEYLAFRGLLKPLEASMLRNELARILRLSTLNPLTREEWEKIKRYLEKDELTLEEALEFRELARKVVDEYGHLTEAWKLHIYASIMVGWAMRKKMEEEGKIEKEQEGQKQC